MEFVDVEQLLEEEQETLKFVFIDVEQLLEEEQETLKFVFLEDYKMTKDFLVAEDLEEFYKLIDPKISVFSIDSMNEWMQLQEQYNIILREVDKYFDKSSIPLSQRISSIG